MRLFSHATLLATLLAPLSAWAQLDPGAPAAPATHEAAPSADTSATDASACPSGNLLAGKSPTVREKVQRYHRITDNRAPAPGAFWDSEYTALLSSGDSYVVYDLGQATRITAMVVQADNNDTYEVELSDDGTQWRHLWQVPSVERAGMQTRTSRSLEGTGRYLRVGYGRGDNYYSLGEVQAFCQAPATFPPRIAVEQATRPKPQELKLTREHLLSIRKLIIGLAGLVLFVGFFWPRQEEAQERTKQILMAAGAVLTLVGLGGAIAGMFVDVKVPIPALIAGGLLGAGLLGAIRFCREAPDRWPLTLKVLGGGHLTTYVAYLTYELWGLVVMGFAFAGGYLWLQKELAAEAQANKKSKGKKKSAAPPRRPWRPLVERAVLIAVLVAGAHTWTNFGTFHGVRAVHLWDSMHYYMGSKYFKENRYHLMYQCAAVAEKDDGRLEEVLTRKYRVLRDNALGPAERALADEPYCREAFTPERWAAFRQDLRLFRTLMSPGWFKDVFNDHGYNASPVWNMVGYAIANFDWKSWIPPEGMENTPANLKGKSPEEKRAIQALFKEQVDRLDLRTKLIALIDGALYVGIFLLIWWAFGLKVAAFTILMWAVGHPWAYYWTGGGFGRVPWLFTAVAGLCLIKKGYNGLGAFGITWSALLRVFPGSLAIGAVLKLLWDLKERRNLTKPHWRMVIGGTLALAVLIPLSLPAADGFSAYPEFVQNSMKHKATPLTNHMGLPTLMSYHPSHVAQKTRDNRFDDPFQRWKELRQQHQEERKPLYYGIVIALLLVVGYLVKEMDDWIAVSLSTVFFFAIFELTCYYFNVIVLLGPLAMLRSRHALTLLAMTIATQVAALIFGWFDELHVVQSALFFGVLIYFMWDMVQERRRGEASTAESPSSHEEAIEEPQPEGAKA